MHELALCDALLKMVRDISREEALDGVRSITVRVGTLSGVIPHFLTDCWVAVTDGTEYDYIAGSKLQSGFAFSVKIGAAGNQQPIAGSQLAHLTLLPGGIGRINRFQRDQSGFF